MRSGRSGTGNEPLSALSITPRGLSRDLAALYVGIPVSHFDNLVQSGQMPAPVSIAGVAAWDRYEVDAAFSALRTAPAQGSASALRKPAVTRYLKASDIAERWGCSPRHVRRMMTTGELPSLHLGSKLLRCDERVVEEFEERQAEMLHRIAEKPTRLKRLDLNALRPLRGSRNRPA